MEITFNIQDLPLKDQINLRLKKLRKNQVYLHKVFKRKPQQINAALRGEQPTLLKKIIAHIELLEQKQNLKEQSASKIIDTENKILENTK